MKKILIITMALFIAQILCASPAAASVLYASRSIPIDTPNDILTVDQTTGLATPLGASGASWVGDMTSDTRAGSVTLWGTNITTGAPFAGQLLTINPATGAATTVGTYDSPSEIVSLAYDPVTNALYGNTSLGFGAAADVLYSINPATGATTQIGQGIGFDAVYALGFDNTGRLFGISNSDLIEINTATGVGTLIVALRASALFDMAARPEDNAMFVAQSGGEIWTLDTTTGALTDVGPHGAGNVVGLAFSPVPEPISVTLLLLGGLALLRKRRT